MKTEEKILQVDEESFEHEVREAKLPVLVDFWAAWCGPCRQLTPVLEELASELDGRVKITKVDVDHNPELPARFQVASIPTLVLFKDGEVADRMVGALPKETLREFITRNL